MSTTQGAQIVIIGGGIIGCTTAYYLSRRLKNKVTLVEVSKYGVAQGASGKAGGLVAKWAYPKELAILSFREHVALAEEHNGGALWGWRYVNCGSWEGRGEVVKEDVKSPGTGDLKSLEKTLGLAGDEVGQGVGAPRQVTGLPDDLTWVSQSLTDSYSSIAPPGDTAQVLPYKFTSSMLELARVNGVEFVAGLATSILMDGSTTGGHGRKVTGIEYRDLSGTTKTIPASHVILAAGAWSPKLIPQSGLPISATRAHSITFQPKEDVSISPYVLFTEIKLPSILGRVTEVSPEIYARPDNEVYACGPGDDPPLPDTVDEVEVDGAACDNIRNHVTSISEVLRDAEVTRRQACVLPVVSTGGGPIIGEASKIAKGLIIATGHTCWGICNAPGTAKAVTELVEYGEIRCAKLKKLQPSLFI